MMAFYKSLSFISGIVTLLLVLLGYILGGSFVWTSAYAGSWLFVIFLVWDLRNLWNRRDITMSEIKEVRKLVTYLSLDPAS